MICPFCKRRLEAWTGFQEAQKFQRHLQKCRKAPSRLRGTATLIDALKIRSESGQ